MNINFEEINKFFIKNVTDTLSNILFLSLYDWLKLIKNNHFLSFTFHLIIHSLNLY